MKFLIVFPVILSAVCCASYYSPVQTTNANMSPTLLDLLRDKFLTLEDTLWTVMNSGLEPSYVLQQIHSGVRTFLTNDFQERFCYFSTFDPEQRVIHDIIRLVNDAVNRTVAEHLFVTRRQFNEMRTLENSAINRDLTKQLDQVFEITGTSDFFNTLKRVNMLFVRFVFHIRKQISEGLK